MQAYAEGFELLNAVRVRARPLRDRGLWNHGSVVRSWLLELAAAAFEKDRGTWEHRAVRRGLRRGSLDGQRGDRERGPAARDHAPRSTAASRRARRSPSRRRCWPRCATSSAVTRCAPSRAKACPPHDDRDRSRNPLREGLKIRAGRAVRDRDLRRVRRPHEPQAPSGALQPLRVRRLLPERLRRRRRRAHRETTTTVPRAMKAAVKQLGRDPIDEAVWKSLTEGLHYVAADFADDEGQNRVAEVSSELDEERGTRGNRLYYLAVPPAAFETIVQRARRAARRTTRRLDARDRREAVRHDRASAHGLNETVQRWFDESEIFRIDHYLGKETVQNILVLPLRERHLRADLEPPVHRPRADHGRRVDRRRGTRGVLRARRRDPGHRPKPPAAARLPDRDGAADRLHGRRGAGREGEGAALPAHARAEVRRARAVRRAASSRARRCPATARRTASIPTR